MTATWMAILIGFLICLGIVGWIFVHYVRVALDKEDSTRIDKIPKNHDSH